MLNDYGPVPELGFCLPIALVADSTHLTPPPADDGLASKKNGLNNTTPGGSGVVPEKVDLTGDPVTVSLTGTMNR